MTSHHAQRKQIRLETYNYSSAGAYFVTICTQLRGYEWFGQVTFTGMQLNQAGEMIQGTWQGLANQFNISLDAFVVMPDHVHGIIVLSGNAVVGQGDDKHRPYETPTTNNSQFTPRRGEPCVRPVTINDSSLTHASGTAVGSLGRIIQAFKSITTNQYIRGVREDNWMPFEKRFWQRNFYDRIVRNDADLERCCDYIEGNPARWLEKANEVIWEKSK